MNEFLDGGMGWPKRAAIINSVKEKGGTIWYPELSNFCPAKFGVRCIVHSHVWVGDEVILGDDVRIQAFAFIPNGVIVGDNVFIGPRVTFTNDKHPPSTNWDTTFVQDGVSIGAGAIILPGLVLGKNCVIGAGAVVTKSIPPNETWWGNPAKPRGGA